MNYPTQLNYQNFPYAQQYPYQQPMQQIPVQAMPQQATQTFGCRPVTSKEEALGVQVDFLGPGTLMPDLGHGIVYLKRFNSNTGTSDIFEFRLAEQQPEQEKPDELAEIRASIERLDAEVEKLKKPKIVRKVVEEDE